MSNLDADTPWAASQREKLRRLHGKQAEATDSAPPPPEGETVTITKKRKKKAKKKTRG